MLTHNLIRNPSTNTGLPRHFTTITYANPTSPADSISSVHSPPAPRPPMFPSLNLDTVTYTAPAAADSPDSIEEVDPLDIVLREQRSRPSSNLIARIITDNGNLSTADQELIRSQLSDLDPTLPDHALTIDQRPPAGLSLDDAISISDEDDIHGL